MCLFGAKVAAGPDRTENLHLYIYNCNQSLKTIK